MTHPHLQRLGAQPRPVGSDANARARGYCAEQLRSLGFQVAERPFEFSALPGRHAAQIIGFIAVVGFGSAAMAPIRWTAPITGLTLIAVTIWLGAKGATRRHWMREKGINLEGARGASPKVWLVAHVDSKSQPISSAMRAASTVLLVFGIFPSLGLISSVLAMIGGLGLVMTHVESKSDGAADNASGVAAVLDAIALLPRDTEVGVLVTDAEELALAGATEWAHGREPGIAINCDTVDDVGRLVVFQYGYRSNVVDDAVAEVIREIDPTTRVMRPPVGVLTDSNAFNRAGWATMTLARGTLRTLNRIHTKRDSLDSMRGTGIPDAARLLARLVEELA